jgi:hypothetical protein
VTGLDTAGLGVERYGLVMAFLLSWAAEWCAAESRPSSSRPIDLDVHVHYDRIGLMVFVVGDRVPHIRMYALGSARCNAMG